MNELEKFIRENWKKGKQEVRKELVSRGYMPNDFEFIFEKIEKENKFRKFYYLALALILIGAIIFRSVHPPIAQDKVMSNEQVFVPIFKEVSNNPDEWVDDEGTVLLDKVDSQVLEYDNVIQFGNEAVFYDGYYKGNHFYDKFVENNETKIQFTENLNALDGIPQIFVVQKKVNGSLMDYVFVDEDWKEQIIPNYIWFGLGFSNYKIFSYENEIKPGVYLETINNSLSLVENNLYGGGLIVGDITPDKVEYEDVNVTFVRIR